MLLIENAIQRKISNFIKPGKPHSCQYRNNQLDWLEQSTAAFHGGRRTYPITLEIKTRFNIVYSTKEKERFNSCFRDKSPNYNESISYGNIPKLKLRHNILLLIISVF